VQCDEARSAAPCGKAWRSETECPCLCAIRDDGENAIKAEAYVRPSAQKDGWFTFENSFGEEQHGTMDQIAQRFAAFDRGLRMKGYIRMHHGNCGGPAFNR